MGKLQVFEEPPDFDAVQQVVYQWVHRGWGDAINIDDWDEGKIHGFLPRPLHEGDYVMFKAQADPSIIIVTRITSIEQKRDPADMFYAVIERLYAVPEAKCPPERIDPGFVLG